MAVPVVVYPHHTFRLEAKKGSEKCTNQGHKAAEGRDAAGDAVCDEGCDGCAAQPGTPVDECVCCKVPGTAEDAEEDIFGGDLDVVSEYSSDATLLKTYVEVKGHRHDQTRNGEAVAHLLHEHVGGPQRRCSDVVAAVDVHDNTDGDVDACGDSTAERERVRVLARVCHFRDDGEVGGHTTEGEDDGSNGCHSLCESWVAKELEVRFVRSRLRSLCRTVLNADCNNESED